MALSERVRAIAAQIKTHSLYVLRSSLPQTRQVGAAGAIKDMEDG